MFENIFNLNFSSQVSIKVQIILFNSFIHERQELVLASKIRSAMTPGNAFQLRWQCSIQAYDACEVRAKLFA